MKYFEIIIEKDISSKEKMDNLLPKIKKEIDRIMNKYHSSKYFRKIDLINKVIFRCGIEPSKYEKNRIRKMIDLWLQTHESKKGKKNLSYTKSDKPSQHQEISKEKDIEPIIMEKDKETNIEPIIIQQDKETNKKNDNPVTTNSIEPPVIDLTVDDIKEEIKSVSEEPKSITQPQPQPQSLCFEEQQFGNPNVFQQPSLNMAPFYNYQHPINHYPNMNFSYFPFPSHYPVNFPVNDPFNNCYQSYPYNLYPNYQYY